MIELGDMPIKAKLILGLTEEGIEEKLSPFHSSCQPSVEFLLRKIGHWFSDVDESPLPERGFSLHRPYLPERANQESEEGFDRLLK